MLPLRSDMLPEGADWEVLLLREELFLLQRHMLQQCSKADLLHHEHERHML